MSFVRPEHQSRLMPEKGVMTHSSECLVNNSSSVPAPVWPDKLESLSVDQDPGSIPQNGFELVGYGFVHYRPLGRHAYLARAEEGCEEDLSRQSSVEINHKTLLAANFRSAEGSMIAGDFPPSSITLGLHCNQHKSPIV